jgi:hypothetical protein
MRMAMPTAAVVTVPVSAAVAVAVSMSTAAAGASAAAVRVVFEFVFSVRGAYKVAEQRALRSGLCARDSGVEVGVRISGRSDLIPPPESILIDCTRCAAAPKHQTIPKRALSISNTSNGKRKGGREGGQPVHGRGEEKAGRVRVRVLRPVRCQWSVCWFVTHLIERVSEFAGCGRFEV